MTRFASLLGGLGVVAVAFGLLSVLAAVFQPITEVTSYVIFGNLILGVVMILDRHPLPSAKPDPTKAPAPPTGEGSA